MTDYAVVLAARMGSERLSGKALAVYCPDGTTNLEQICRRWLASDRQPQLIIATPDSADNDPIARIGERLGLPVSRRDATLPRNVVNEIDLALATYAPDAKWIARAMADNPLVDVGLADWRLDVLAETGAEGLWYGGDHARITYAGTTDVWSRAAWDRIARESSGCQLEHAGSYYWDHISRFNVVQLPLPRREYLLPVRTELDTEQDLEMFKALWGESKAFYESCYRWAWAPPETHLPPYTYLSTLPALGFIGARPKLAAINAEIEVRTQSRPAYPNHFKPWKCTSCGDRIATLVNGNLRFSCPNCGSENQYMSRNTLTRSR